MVPPHPLPKDPDHLRLLLPSSQRRLVACGIRPAALVPLWQWRPFVPVRFVKAIEGTLHLLRSGTELDFSGEETVGDGVRHGVTRSAVRDLYSLPRRRLALQLEPHISIEEVRGRI